MTKELGELVEAEVAEALEDLELLGESKEDGDARSHDAVATAPISLFQALDRVGGSVVFADVDAIEPETPLEIKGTQRRVSNGTRDTFGRFYVRRSQHERLAEIDGLYVLSVYEEVDDGVDLEGLLVGSPDVVDERLNSWTRAGAGRETYTQIAWRDFPFNGSLAVES